jgi:hypothetical protein
MSTNNNNNNTTTDPTDSTSTGSTNFIDYSSLYYSPGNLPPGVDMTQAYTNSLFTGTNGTINANIQQVQPGNRYFIDTHTTCKDENSNIHKRSILIDNVMSSTLANPQKQGLIYSILASLNNINPLSSIDSSFSVCKPVSVYINGSNRGATTSGWVSSTEYNKIDPQAINQGETAAANNPTATPSATPTATPSATPSATPTATPSATPTATPSATPTATPYTPWQPPSWQSPFIQGFCSSDTCLQNKTHDTIVQFYLAGLVVLSGYIVYNAITRK